MTADISQKTFLVIIPARGGSKAIKDKNIVDVCGKPLIEYTIVPALKLRNRPDVKKVIVSTDSSKIASVAEQSGIDVPFLRPQELAADHSKSIDYVLHALDFFEQKHLCFDAVIILQPTVPLRTYADLVQAIELFAANKSDSLISVFKEEYICDLVLYKKEGNLAIPVNQAHNKQVRRQEHGATYVRNGAIYITAVEYLRQTHQIIADSPLCYVMPKSRSINIDTMEDLNMARAILCQKES